MGEVEGLIREYAAFVRQPWERHIAGPQKVWFAIYDPSQERRLRFRLSEFEVATKHAGHGWRHLDLTDAFAEWMAGHDYRESHFEHPEDLELALPDFAAAIADRVKGAVTEPGAGDNTVVAIVGAGALFGLARVSTLVEEVAPLVRGRLLVFFPGQYEGSNYRLLDARDGWNYLAVPITAKQGE